jgi:WD40 repeat protein
MELTNGCIVTWSGHTLRIWDGQSGVLLATLEGHTGFIKSVLELSNGHILSWEWGIWDLVPALRLWDERSGAALASFEGHTDRIKGAVELTDGRILSWADDNTLRLWDGESGAPLTILEGHTYHIDGALELTNGHIVSWADYGTMLLWDGQSGAPLASLEGHHYWIKGALELPDGRILSWSGNESLIFDAKSGQLVSGPIWISDLPWLAPQILHRQLAFDAPHAISGQSFGCDAGMRAMIASCITQAIPICWHGHFTIKKINALSPEGILVVSLDSGHVLCLQLFRGAQRITLKDYESSSSPDVDNPVQR